MQTNVNPITNYHYFQYMIFCFKESLRLVQYLPLFFCGWSLLCILWWVNYFQERWTKKSSAKSHGGPGLPGEWLGFASKLGHHLRIQRWVEKSRYPEMFPILPSENFACCLLVPYCQWLFLLHWIFKTVLWIDPHLETRGHLEHGSTPRILSWSWWETMLVAFFVASKSKWHSWHFPWRKSNFTVGSSPEICFSQAGETQMSRKLVGPFSVPNSLHHILPFLEPLKQPCHRNPFHWTSCWTPQQHNEHLPRPTSPWQGSLESYEVHRKGIEICGHHETQWLVMNVDGPMASDDPILIRRPRWACEIYVQRCLRRN